MDKWRKALEIANNSPRCGAKTRGGHSCKSPAMKNGRCRMHGGKSLSGKNHGRYKHGCYTYDFKRAQKEMSALIQGAKKLVDSNQ